MKIVQFQMHAGTGGAETVARLLSRGWSGMGHAPRIQPLSRSTSGPLAKSEGVRGQLRRFRAVRSVLRSVRPELVVVHATIPGLYVRLATSVSRRYRGRVLQVAHSGADDYRDWRLRLAERVISEINPPVLLTVNSELAAKHAEYGFRTRGRPVVVPNPVDDSFIPTGSVERDRHRVLMVGRVVPVKDVVTGLRAVRRLVDEDELTRLDIVGDQTDREYVEVVKSSIHSLALDGVVNLRPPTDDLPRLFATAGALLHCSLHESGSLVLWEAALAGLPTVASEGAARPVAGVLDIAIFPTGDDEMAAALVKLALNDGSSERSVPAWWNVRSPTAVAKAYLTAWEATQTHSPART